MNPRLSPALVALALSLAACGGASGGTDSTGVDSTGVDTDAPTTDAPTTGDTTAPETGGSATGDPSSTTGDATSDATGDATGPSETTAETSTGAVEQELPPTDSADALEAWLARGSYKTWAAESTVHPSAGPHGGNVRTYVNDVLLGSLAAAGASHPQGAATVKELYGGGVDAITGYAVMVKLAPDSQAGDGWYWYERLDGTTYADGTGVGLCTGCHEGGADYVLTPYPLQ